MSDTNWLTPKELRALAHICESLDPLWDVLTSRHEGLEVEMGGDLRIAIFDSSGNTQGYVTWAEDGAAFYPGGDS